MAEPTLPTPTPDAPDWIAALRRRADVPPLAPRLPLRSEDGATIGSVETTLAQRLLAAPLPLREAGGALALTGPLDPALDRLARWLHEAAVGGRWRDESLAVTDESGAVRGRIERAAVRPLGIATRAVHLVGRSADGGVWLQQRAHDKATDPGLWDTLMGGLVSAGESVEATLVRETWEEAGLRPEQWRDLRPLGRVTVRRPVTEGYMVEAIDAFEATLRPGALPVNQDGEVQRFDCIALPALRERLAAGDFTLEAALVLLRLLDGTPEDGPGAA